MMNDPQQDDGFLTGIIAGALVGAIAAAVMLRRRFPAGAGSDERYLELPPPDGATQETARTEAAAIVARLRSAFPNLARIDT
ncbi:MAG: hypothetical protein ACUVSY_01105 [Roseiflexus sp.]